MMPALRPASLALLLALAPSTPASTSPDQGTRAEPVPTGVEVVRLVGDPSETRRTFWQRLAGAEPQSAFLRPYGVAWDGEDLLVTDPSRSAVARVDPRNRRTDSPAGLFASPIGVAACAGGVVVTDSVQRRVVLLDERLRFVRDLATDLERPTGIACAEGTIYVIDTGTHSLWALDPRSGERHRFGGRGEGPAKLNFPSALAATPTQLWIGDTLNFRLQSWSRLDGAFLSSWGNLGDALGDTPRIKGIAPDPQRQRVWVTDGYLDRVMVFSLDGALLSEVGGPGSAPGQFSFPAGIAVHRDGRIAVADSLNRRVQVLRLTEDPKDGHDR